MHRVFKNISLLSLTVNINKISHLFVEVRNSSAKKKSTVEYIARHWLGNLLKQSQLTKYNIWSINIKYSASRNPYISWHNVHHRLHLELRSIKIMLKLQVLFWLLLLFSLAKSQQCNWQYNLQPNRPINITSSNYPGAFPAGSSCRYQLHAPASHVIRLTCRFEVVSFHREHIVTLSVVSSVVFNSGLHCSSPTTVSPTSCSSPATETCSSGMRSAFAAWV